MLQCAESCGFGHSWGQRLLIFYQFIRAVMGACTSSEYVTLIEGIKWQPDFARPNCRGCNDRFTVVVRKHHCRSCGEIFCSNCASHREVLPQLRVEQPVRICDSCLYRKKHVVGSLERRVEQLRSQVLSWIELDDESLLMLPRDELREVIQELEDLSEAVNSPLVFPLFKGDKVLLKALHELGEVTRRWKKSKQAMEEMIQMRLMENTVTETSNKFKSASQPFAALGGTSSDALLVDVCL